MDIETLTVGDIRKLAAMVNGGLANVLASGATVSDPSIGKYCIVRCRNAGVHAGVVVYADSNNVVLENSRRMWRWNSRFTLTEAAIHGINADKSKIAEILNVPLVLNAADVCERIPCSAQARLTIEEAPNANE